MAQDDTPEAVVRVRLAMSHAFGSMVLKAYDALLNYGINYRTLPAYKDTSLLDAAASLPISRGQSAYITWMQRVESDIRAAIHRKSFKKV